jgi:hypothetical protein
VIIAASLAVAAQAVSVPPSVQWEPVAADTGGRYEISATSVVRDGDRVHFLMRAFAARPADDGASVAILRYMMDCRRRLANVEALDIYRADGSLVESVQQPSPVAPIAEATAEAPVLQRVCAQATR